MQISVKKLGSQNHTFDNLNNEMTIWDFKQHISKLVGLPADEQKLIFRGAVLPDDSKLKDYELVFHLMKKPSQSQSAKNVTKQSEKGASGIIRDEEVDGEFKIEDISKLVLEKNNKTIEIKPKVNVNVRSGSNFKDSIFMNLPEEWIDTVQHDIGVQLGMPENQNFSPGYKILFHHHCSK